MTYTINNPESEPLMATDTERWFSDASLLMAVKRLRAWLLPRPAPKPKVRIAAVQRDTFNCSACGSGPWHDSWSPEFHAPTPNQPMTTTPPRYRARNGGQ